MIGVGLHHLSQFRIGLEGVVSRDADGHLLLEELLAQSKAVQEVGLLDAIFEIDSKAIGVTVAIDRGVFPQCSRGVERNIVRKSVIREIERRSLDHVVTALTTELYAEFDTVTIADRTVQTIDLTFGDVAIGRVRNSIFDKGEGTECIV